MDKSISLIFRESATVKTALERIKQIPDIISIECVFPNTTVSRLVGLYVVKVGQFAVKQVLVKLRQDPDVESANESATRRPM